MGMEVIRLDEIELEPRAQPRAKMSTEVVEEYAERMNAGDEFPPLKVAFIPGKETDRLVLIGGWHRYEAMRLIGMVDARCDVEQFDTLEAAIVEACRQNIGHGLRRSVEDKRHVVRTLLEIDPERSDNSIADDAGVSHTFVGILRREMSAASDVRRGKDGVVRVVPVKDAAPAQADEAHDEAEAKPLIIQDTVKRGSIQDKMRSATVEFDRVLDRINDLERDLKDFCEEDHASFVSKQSVLSDIKNLRHSITAGKPFKVCPLCDGEKCRTCRSEGWVSRQQWSLIPEDQR